MRRGLGGIQRVRPADLRHRITIEKQTQTKDSSHQVIVTYSTRFSQEPASYEEVTGGEFLRGRQVTASANAVFVVNYRFGYTTRDRILHDGTYFEIVRVHSPKGIKRYLELEAKATGV